MIVTLSPQEKQGAAETLAALASIRRESRRSLGEPWFPAVCFGIITLLSAPLVAAGGVIALVPLWSIVGSAGMALTQRHYRQANRSQGITPRRSLRSISFGLFAFCFVAAGVGGLLGGRTAGLAIPIVVVTLGYGLIGMLRHDPLPPLFIAPGALLAVVIAVRGSEPWVVAVVFGTTLVLAGALLRRVSRTRVTVTG